MKLFSASNDSGFRILYLRLFDAPFILSVCLQFVVSFAAFSQPPVSGEDCGRTSLYFNSATNVSTEIPELSGTTQGSGTWEAWIKKENWSSYGGDEKLFMNDYDYPSESAFYISLHSSAEVGLHFRTGYSNGSYISNTSTFGFTANSWHHFAATWSESGGTVTTTIFIDGVAAGSITSTSTFDLESTFYLGGKDGSFKMRQGEMAEVRVWNVARTEQEIADNRNSLLAGNESGLVAYWPLNEETGSTVATNMVSGGSDGTVNYLDAVSGWRGFPLTFQESGSLIIRGDTYDFGTQLTNESSEARVFTITNHSSSSIDLSANPISALAGDDAAEFELDLTSTVTSMAAGASTTFSITFTPTTEGAKTALFSFANVSGCSDPFTIVLEGTSSTLAASINVDANVSIYGDSGGALTASATGGTEPYSYLWSNSQTSATISGLSAGEYSVVVTDDIGASVEVAATITQPEELVVSIELVSNVTVINENDGVLTASASGGVEPYDYLWNNEATTASITSLTAGDYEVTVTDANGATASETVTVTQPLPLVANIQVVTEVSGDGAYGELAAYAYSGTKPYAYLWNTGATTQVISGLTVGTYTVTITDDVDTEESATVILEQDARMTYEGNFYESSDNDGSVHGSGVISLVGDIFNSDDDVLDESEVTVSGIPAGLGYTFGVSERRFALDDWVSKALPEEITEYWSAMAYGNGAYVAVSGSYGQEAGIMSLDGVSWQVANMPTYSWQSIAYGNGKFVAISTYNNRVTTSTDGITWTEATSVGSYGNWFDLAFGNGRFVAVGEDFIVTSQDGITWEEPITFEDLNWKNITYGAGKFVAIGSSGELATSSDGANWSLQEETSISNISDIAYGDGLFVAVTDNSGSSSIWTSPDGIAWTERSTPIVHSWKSIAYGHGGFVVTTDYSASGSSIILTSTNGLDWSSVSLESSSGLEVVAFADGKFVAFSDDSYGPAWTSYHGSVAALTLTGQADEHQNSNDVSEITFDISDAAFANVAASSVTNATSYSSGIGIDFSDNPFITISGEGFTESNSTEGIVEGSILFTLTGENFQDDNDDDQLAIGSEVTISDVPDGLTPVFTITDQNTQGEDWVNITDTSITDTWSLAAFGNGTYVALDGDYDFIFSTDGENWTEGELDEDDWEDIIFVNGLFVAVGDYILMSSSDGINWNYQEIDGEWEGITYGEGLFVAVGDNDVLTSSDGLNWTRKEDISDFSLYSVAYGNGKFVAVSTSSNYVTVSEDGLTWATSNYYSEYSESLYDIEFHNGIFVAISNSNAYTSNDGVTWDQHSIESGSWTGLSSGGGQFILFSESSPSETQILRSVDGENWTGVEPFVDAGLNTLLYVNGSFLLFTDDQDDYQWLYKSDKTYASAELIFSGLPTDHQSENSVEEITLAFSDDAFISTQAAYVINATGPVGTGLGINFFNTVGSLAYSPGSYEWTESSTNDGSIDGNAVSITLTGHTFIRSSGELTQGTEFSVEGLPEGLVPVMALNSSTQAELSITGNAIAHFSDSFRALSIIFEDAAFTSAAGPEILNAVGYDGFGISFTYNPNITYAGDGFVETEAKDGSVEGSIILTLDGETYRDDNEDGLLHIDTEVVVNNVPDGLSPVLSITANQKLGDVWEPKSQLNFSYNNMAYGNGIYVAVSGSISNGQNVIGTSTNGYDWYETQFATSISWVEVIFAGGQFIAVGSDGGTPKVLTSNDGLEWTIQTIPTTLDGKLGIAYGNGLYVVVSSSGEDRIMTSPDGIAWTEANGLESSWYDVAYGNGMFVAVAHDYDHQVMTSTDGINWSFQDGTDEGYWYDVTYGNGLFIAVSDDDYGMMMTSPDGINWSSPDIPSDNYLTRVTYGGGLFLVPEYGRMKLIKSEDGINWTEQALTNEIYRTIYAEGKFVAIPRNPGYVTVSQELSEAKLELSGQGTSHQQIHGIADITFEFTDAAFTNSVATNVENATGPANSGLGVVFTDNPDNDDCTTPEVLTLYTPGEGTPTEGSTLNAALSDELIPCTEATGIKDVWYSFNSGESGQVVITAEVGTALAVSGAVYTSCGEILQVPNPFDDGNLPACANNVDEPVFLALSPNTDFLLQVWNTGEDAGTFSVLLEKNLSPTIATIEDKEVDEETEIQFTVTAEDEFLPNGEIEYYLISEFTDLGMSINSETGQFSWTPSEAQDGAYAVTVLAVDYYDSEGENVSSTSVTFTLTVTEVNEAPMLAAIENQTLGAGAVAEFSASATDADLPANTLTYSLDATSLEKGMSISGETGAFSWEPLPTYFGMTSEVTLSVSDGELTDQETFNLEVGIGSQTITFGELADRPYNNEPFELTATASSGLSLSYISSDETVATISGSTVTLVGVGTTTITASQSGSTNYEAAEDVNQTLTVSKANQTITFDPLVAITYGEVADFELSATASSGLGVSYSSSYDTVASMYANIVIIYGAGSTTITVNQTGNTNYNAAAPVEQILTIIKASQTITFDALAAKTFGDDDFDLAAEASSGWDVTFSSSNESVATISGNTVTIIGGGEAIITASQAGTANYAAAAPVEQTLTVNPVSQTITFESLGNKTYGEADFDLTATASSGVGVSYSSSDETVATITGNTVTIIGTGTTTITASQAGNATYTAATSVEQTLTVKKANQTISFESLPAKTFGDDDFDLAAEASSGWDVTFSSSNESVATISGNTVTIIGGGEVIITASQSGTANYAAATSVEQTLTVNPVSQTITFDPLATKTYGQADFDLTATASSGVGVSYSSSDETVATITGNTVTIVGTGTTTITASQAGNDNYTAASVDQTLTIFQTGQTLTFGTLENKTYGDGPFNLSASGGASGIPVTFSSSDESIAIISGTTVTMVGAGETTITASQEGNDHYAAADHVTQTLTVLQAGQAITFGTLENKTYGDDPFDLSASGGASGIPVTFSSSDESIAIVSGTTVTMVGAGETTITASQEGNDHYAAADDVMHTLLIDPASLTVTADEKGKAYGETDPQFTYEITSGNLVDGDQLNGNLLREQGEDAGSYPILQGTLSAGPNYTFNFIAGELTISQGTLLITAINQHITYGETVPELTFTVEGFTNEDNETDVNLPAISTTAAGIPVAGTYPITLSGGEAINYSLELIHGTLTVAKASLKVTANDQTRVYGQANPDFTVTYLGFMNGEGVSALSSLPVTSSPATALSNVGSYLIEVSGGSSDSYAFSYEAGELTISKAPAMIIVSDTLHLADGEPKSPTITTDPEGLTFMMTFDGNEEMPSAPGTYQLFIEITDQNHQGERAVSFVLNENELMALGTPRNPSIAIYPNPASRWILIRSSERQPVEIFDLQGQLHLSGQSNETMDVSNLPEGMYVVRVEDSYIKFIKK